MRLYDRDYSIIITDEEREAQDAYIKFKDKRIKRAHDFDPRVMHPDFECRRFIWRYNSLFPNNYLEPIRQFKDDLERPEFISEAAVFKSFINVYGDESEIQKNIKDNRKWFIPGSIFKCYNFGHHDAYLFPEMQLGTKYRVDYALLGRNSDGYSLVLVEFEKASCDFILKSSSTESKEVRNGIAQIRDWKQWIDSNREHHLREAGFTDKGIDIPSSMIHYCLVVSRRERMGERARKLRNQICADMNNTKIISYDRLIDNMWNLDHGY